MNIHLTPEQTLIGIAVLLSPFLLWRAGARRARAAAEAARTSVRLVSLAGRVLVTAGLIVGVQWLVITHPGNVTLLLVVLTLPDLLAAWVLTRTLTVTTMDSRTGRRGGR